MLADSAGMSSGSLMIGLSTVCEGLVGMARRGGLGAGRVARSKATPEITPKPSNATAPATRNTGLTPYHFRLAGLLRVSAMPYP